MTAHTHGSEKRGVGLSLFPAPAENENNVTGSPSATSACFCVPVPGPNCLLIRRQKKKRHWAAWIQKKAATQRNKPWQLPERASLVRQGGLADG